MTSTPEALLEYDTYLCALRAAFHDEPWEAIEIYAARIWKACGLESSRPWDEAAAMVRDAFRDPSGAPAGWDGPLVDEPRT